MSATNYAKASYTEVIDFQTVAGKTGIIGIHTPQGRAPYMKLRGFFTQFKKYRYKGISSLVCCPASSLPVDPLGLTSVVGTTDQIDPRDVLNPILFKGCHGEHLTAVLDNIFSTEEWINSTSGENDGAGISPSLSKVDLTTTFINQYYSFLTDNSWRKFGTQQVIKIKNLHPLVWKVARNNPLNPTWREDVGTIAGTTAGQGVNHPSDNQTPRSPRETSSILGNNPTRGARPEFTQEFTNGCARLGWMPTTINVQTNDGVSSVAVSGLPKLFMGVMLTAPAYNVEQFWRMVIRHEFEFKDFDTCTGIMNPSNVSLPPATSEYGGYFNTIDYGESKLYEGGTLDMLDGDAKVISDGVM